MTPFDHDRAAAAARPLLDDAGDAQVEVVFTGSDTRVTRYANSSVIQNVVKRETRAYVRVLRNGSAAMAATTTVDAGGLRAALQSAERAAEASPPDPDLPGLASPDEVGRPQPTMRWDEATATASARERAERVADILRVTGGAATAGIFETGSHAFSVFNSRGVDCHDAFSRCVVTCLPDDGEATGWSSASSHRLSDVDAAATAEIAMQKLRSGHDPRVAEPGKYAVVLEPIALATLLEYLSYAGFGAKQVLEGESFLSTRAGESVAGPSVTVADDVRHPLSVGIGFDVEGVPRRRVAVIDAGVATGPVSDLRTAQKLETSSTGHSSGSTEYGPYAANIVMEGGNGTTEDLIATVDDGFLVTRFHYVNILDRPTALLTGMTRDGTYRIRKGEVAEPVNNFRFSQGAIDMLASTTGMSSGLEAFAPEYGHFGSTVAPAALVEGFTFSSTTTH